LDLFTPFRRKFNRPYTNRKPLASKYNQALGCGKRPVYKALAARMVCRAGATALHWGHRSRASSAARAQRSRGKRVPRAKPPL